MFPVISVEQCSSSIESVDSLYAPVSAFIEDFAKNTMEEHVASQAAVYRKPAKSLQPQGMLLGILWTNHVEAQNHCM
jgi:hypothetical protein